MNTATFREEEGGPVPVPDHPLSGPVGIVAPWGASYKQRTSVRQFVNRFSGAVHRWRSNCTPEACVPLAQYSAGRVDWAQRNSLRKRSQDRLASHAAKKRGKETALQNSYPVWRIEYSRCSVRINKRSPTSAGDASVKSSSSFTCNNLNSSPVDDHERLAFLAQAEQLAVVSPGRSRESRRRRIDPRLVSLLAGPGVKAGQDSCLSQRSTWRLHKPRTTADKCPRARLRPDDIFVRGLIFSERDVACRAGTDREQGRPRPPLI